MGLFRPLLLSQYLEFVNNDEQQVAQFLFYSHYSTKEEEEALDTQWRFIAVAQILWHLFLLCGFILGTLGTPGWKAEFAWFWVRSGVKHHHLYVLAVSIAFVHIKLSSAQQHFSLPQI